ATPAASPPESAAPVAAQSTVEQAVASQESGATEADHSPSDASLRRSPGAPAAAQLPPGKWQPGVNYTVLVPAQPTSVSAGKVEVLEVFWLGGPHCYALRAPPKAW